MSPEVALLVGVLVGATSVLLAQMVSAYARIGAGLQEVLMMTAKAREDTYAFMRGRDHEDADDPRHNTQASTEPVLDDFAPFEPEPEQSKALPMDPKNPPVERTYDPRPGSVIKACHCHDRALTPGEKVLWWPNPEPNGGVWLICSQTIAEGIERV